MTAVRETFGQVFPHADDTSLDALRTLIDSTHGDLPNDLRTDTDEDL